MESQSYKTAPKIRMIKNVFLIKPIANESISTFMG